MSKTSRGVLFALLAFLIGAAGGIQARGETADAIDTPVCYEAVFVNDSPAAVRLTRLESELPNGGAYVGLAAGSQVSSEAQESGGRLIWEGPFSLPPDGELSLRYWLAPTESATQLPSLEIVAFTAEGVLMHAVAQPDCPTSAAVLVPEEAAYPEDVTVEKAVETPVLEPGDELTVAYVVTFTNSVASPAVLDWITDNLAPGFEFVGMAGGSDVAEQPVDPQASTIVWEGPFIVPGQGTLRMRYWVKAVEAGGTYTNTVEAISGGQTIGPAMATVTISRPLVLLPLLLRNYQAFVPTPVLSVDKVASPTAVNTGELVTYDVKISNPEPSEGTVSVISDALPAGFSFQQMDPGSDVIENPLGSTGTIVWSGPFAVPSESEIHLIYQVRTGGLGTWTNSVLVQDAGGNVYGPAESAVTTFLEETFDTDVPPEWTPFVNYPGLSPALWFWKGGVGWGRYDFDPHALGSNYKYWGLSMYEAEQAEASTDYRIEATIRTGRHTKNPLTGIWFRGKHQLRTDLQGGDVTGYYLVLKEKDNTVRLGKIRAADRKFDAVDWVQTSTYAPGIENFIWYDVVIEVEGSHIRGWVEGVSMIDWSDPAPWTEGTVGLVAYEGAGFDEISVSALDN